MTGIPWNKGLTAKTDERVARSVKKSAASHRGVKLGPPTLDHCRKLSVAHKGMKATVSARRKMSSSHTGTHHSVAQRKAIAAGARRHAALELPNCKCMMHKSRYSTRLSKLMIKLFLSEFPEVVEEKRFGRFRVDAYLPQPYHLAFEADGEYWHSMRKDKDKARDKMLFEKYGLPVIRLTQQEIKFADKKGRF